MPKLGETLNPHSRPHIWPATSFARATDTSISCHEVSTPNHHWNPPGNPRAWLQEGDSLLRIRPSTSLVHAKGQLACRSCPDGHEQTCTTSSSRKRTGVDVTGVTTKRGPLVDHVLRGATRRNNKPRGRKEGRDQPHGVHDRKRQKSLEVVLHENHFCLLTNRQIGALMMYETRQRARTIKAKYKIRKVAYISSKRSPATPLGLLATRPTRKRLTTRTCSLLKKHPWKVTNGDIAQK